MTDISWRRHAVALLADKPTEWRRLSELFAAVEQSIPIHSALRFQDTKIRAQAKRGKVTPEVGVNTARWRLFLSHVLPLIERRVECGVLTYGAKQTDLVRLRAWSEPCDKCGGPRYLTAMPPRGGTRRKYDCPACTAPVVSTPEPTPEPVSVPQPEPELVPEPVSVPQPEPELAPEPEPEPVIVAPPPAPKPPIKIAIVHKPKPIPKPAPPPAIIKPVIRRPAGMLSSLAEIWEEFERSTLMPKFQDNPKLRRVLHRASEAGGVDQYCRLVTSADIELAVLSYPNKDSMVDIWNERATQWIVTHLPPHQGRRWGDLVIQIYSYTAYAILQIGLHGRITVVQREMERLIMLLPQPKSSKPPSPARQIWTTMVKGAKGMVSHYRIK